MRRALLLLALLSGFAFAQGPTLIGPFRLDGSDAGGGGAGIGSLNGLAGASQTFARVNDTNVTLTIGSSGTTHTFTLGWTGGLAATRGGTGQTTFTLGDIVYSSAANTLAKLAGNTTTTRKFLRQTGDGALSAAPAWDTLVAGDIPSLPASIITSGTLGLARGGLGLDASASAGFPAFSGGAVTMRSIAVTSGHLTIADAAGAAGNPTLGLPSVVSAGSCTACDLTVDAQGRVTAKANGSGGGGGGATTALDNLASVAINAPLTTGAGTVASLRATAPVQTTDAQAGTAADLKASDAVAGNTNAGGANGGKVTIRAGDGKRLTSGDPDGGGIDLYPGTGLNNANGGKVMVFPQYNGVPVLQINGASIGIGVKNSGISFSDDSGISPYIFQSATMLISAGTLSVLSGGTAFASTLQTGNYTITLHDYYILCDATGGAVTLTLPAVSAVYPGQTYRVKKIDASVNACTITRAGSDTIDGATTKALALQYSSTSIVAPPSGSDWGVF